MNYTYTASGGVLILGCVTSIELIQNYSCIFAVGTSPYVLWRAQLGDLEQVTIKKINLVDPNPNNTILNYQDTFNGIWLEGELVWHDEAVELALDYWENVSLEKNRLANCIIA